MSSEQLQQPANSRIRRRLHKSILSLTSRIDYNSKAITALLAAYPQFIHTSFTDLFMRLPAVEQAFVQAWQEFGRKCASLPCAGMGIRCPYSGLSDAGVACLWGFLRSKRNELEILKVSAASMLETVGG